LGGDTFGTADPNGPKGHSLSYDVVFSKKSCGEEEGRGAVMALFFPSHPYM